tara:strand:- start:5123 stop:5377 length:255 start_codon:yes stop_codon:yes gene_type:complete
MSLLNEHYHNKKVNEYLFSLLTEKQLDHYLEWEKRFAHEMSLKKAIRMIYEAYYEDEKRDFYEEGCPVDHIFHAILALVEVYGE